MSKGRIFQLVYDKSELMLADTDIKLLVSVFSKQFPDDTLIVLPDTMSFKHISVEDLLHIKKMIDDTLSDLCEET